MTSRSAAVRIHRSSLAVAGTLAALVVGVVALIVLKIGPAQHLDPLVTTYHHLPQFARDLLGGGRLMSSHG
jgi:hypothetical protein